MVNSITLGMPVMRNMMARSAVCKMIFTVLSLVSCVYEIIQLFQKLYTTKNQI